MGKLMNLDYLMDTELVTKVNTDGYLAGIAEHYPDIIDIFLKLQYFVGELDLVDTKFGQFQSFCFDSYIQAPYTFWVTFNLRDPRCLTPTYQLMKNRDRIVYHQVKGAIPKGI